MKNKLTDLNDHLFAQIERLSDEDTKGAALLEEIERSEAITEVAKAIVSNAGLQLSVIKLKAAHKGLQAGDMPVMLGTDK